ncbi:hypothetical protein M758_2G196500 [Ceratodon purpureus]|nr:hypothetical protein M758_2G196500 [Ceratodon purpureus]
MRKFNSDVVWQSTHKGSLHWKQNDVSFAWVMDFGIILRCLNLFTRLPFPLNFDLFTRMVGDFSIRCGKPILVNEEMNISNLCSGLAGEVFAKEAEKVCSKGRCSTAVCLKVRLSSYHPH